MSAPEVSVVVVLRSGADAASLPGLFEALGSHDVPLETVVVHPGDVHPTVPDGVRTVAVDRSRIGTGRAAGVAAARGRAVTFLQAGDRLQPGALSIGLRALDAHPDAGFVYGRVRPGGDRPRDEERAAARDVHVDHYVELLRGNLVGPACAALFRRSALDAAGPHSTDLGLFLRLARIAPVHFHGALVAESDPSSVGTDLAELAALRAERPHVGRATRYRTAYDEGVTRLVTRAGVRLGNDIRAARRNPRTALRAAARLSGLLAAHPRAVPSFLGAELLPWVARRRPGSPTLQLLAGSAERAPGAATGRRIGEAVRHTVPAGAPVVVLGRPDPGLDLGGRDVRFVAPSDWASVRAVPGAFLLVPQTSDWELDRSPGARAELLSTWQRVWSDETCTIAAASALDEEPRVLVAGYFSFPDAHATAGDLLVRDQVCRWLEEAGRPYDVAHAPPFVGGVDWRSVDPTRYSHVVFACGPFSPDLASWELLQRFPAARSVGVNLSMLVPLDEWNPFDALVERDSSRTARPDVAFGTTEPKVPVVGVCLREHAPGTRTANAAIRRLVEATPMAAVPIDTRLDVMHGGTNSTGQRTAAEVESLLARMDVVVTTRLHGLVLALKNGVPVVAVDPGNEGDKIRRQAESVGWPVVFGVDEVTDEGLRRALEFCATAEARALAAECAGRARAEGTRVRDLLMAELARPAVAVGG